MANIINGTDTGSGGLITTGDSSDELQLQTAETARVTLTNTAVVVNEDGNDVDFRVEGDTEANLLFVDASADRVGVGTSTPGFRTVIKQNSAGAIAQVLQLENNAAIATGKGLKIGFGLGDNEGSTRGYIEAALDASNGTYMAFATNDGATGTYEAFRVDRNGNLLVRTTSQISAGRLCIDFNQSTHQAIAMRNNNAGNGANYVLFRNSADVTAGVISQTGATTVNYGTSSDYRLKENVAPMTGALAKVLELNPVTYTWKADGSAGEGFIAHELQAVCPDAVVGEKDATEIRQVQVSPSVPATYDEEGNELTLAVDAVYEEREVPVYQNVDTSFLVATLTAAIQELKAELDEAKARIAALENA